MSTAQVVQIDVAALDAWRKRLDAARGKAIDGLLTFARACYEFHQDCDAKQGGSVYTEKMREWYGIAHQPASMWATVGKYAPKFSDASEKFPPSMETLYYLCEVPDNVIRDRVTEKTTNREARALKEEHAPGKRRQVAPAPDEPAAEKKTFAALLDEHGITRKDAARCMRLAWNYPGSDERRDFAKQIAAAEQPEDEFEFRWQIDRLRDGEPSRGADACLLDSKEPDRHGRPMRTRVETLCGCAVLSRWMPAGKGRYVNTDSLLILRDELPDIIAALQESLRQDEADKPD